MRNDNSLFVSQSVMYLLLVFCYLLLIHLVPFLDCPTWYYHVGTSCMSHEYSINCLRPLIKKTVLTVKTVKTGIESLLPTDS